jgi:hypothetical protein
MLTLDNLPNRIDDANLNGAPHAADAGFVRYRSGSDRSFQYMIWPAHIGGVQHNVRISTSELSRISCDAFTIDSLKINAALCKYRPLIERVASAAFIQGTAETTLDIGSLG